MVRQEAQMILLHSLSPPFWNGTLHFRFGHRRNDCCRNGVFGMISRIELCRFLASLALVRSFLALEARLELALWTVKVAKAFVILVLFAAPRALAIERIT
jgi:hypothetical protein